MNFPYSEARLLAWVNRPKPWVSALLAIIEGAHPERAKMLPQVVGRSAYNVLGPTPNGYLSRVLENER